MSILQNLTQGAYSREQTIVGNQYNKEYKYNYRDKYNASSLGFSQRFSIEIKFKKQDEDKLELSGKTVAKFFTSNDTDDTKNQFYEGTCTFKRELSNFSPTLIVSEKSKKFRTPWLENEKGVNISINTSKTYLPGVKNKIDTVIAGKLS
jgi:hypothetical protein